MWLKNNIQITQMTYVINVISECLSMSEKAWFIKYYQQLAQMGIPSLKKEKTHFTFVSIYSINFKLNEIYVFNNL